MSENGSPQEMLTSGTQVLNQLFSLQAMFQEMVPSPDSWKHPEKARDAVGAQMDWSERTLNRNTLDFVDKCRDHLLITMKTAGVDGHQVDVPMVDRSRNQVVMRKIPFRDLILRSFKDIRMSILRHQNAYFRQIRYFFEIQITGGQIPGFPYKEPAEEGYEVLVPLKDSSDPPGS